jgi:hypothetical protein
VKGQWIGKIQSDGECTIILNIDDLGSKYAGVAFVTPDDTKLPAIAGFFQTPDKKRENIITAHIMPIDPRTSITTIWDEIKQLYPDVSLSKEAKINLNINENELHIDGKTDLGYEVKGTIIKKDYSDLSDITGNNKSWEEYKNFVSTLTGQKNLFRGQRRPWKLRTFFHRKRRYDLDRFLREDIPSLHRHLSSKTSHVFNLDIPNENGAFLNLVQHHGYPTPLLDWTYSPYVAAFFAFRREPKKRQGDNFVRIYIFNQVLWKTHWLNVNRLNTSGLHLSIMEFLAIENQRLVPQQSVTTVTNIDDVESYIKTMENKNNCSYLTAIDIPASERNKVMQELSFMGITAGSMFPGLEGACEELKERMFDE